MIYDDARMLDDLERRAQEQIKEDSQRNYSDSLFQTAVHLSRIDPETGYDDYDPRDVPEPEEWRIPEDMVITLADVLPAENSDAVELDRR